MSLIYAQKNGVGTKALLGAGLALLMFSAAQAQTETAAENGANSGMEKSVFGHLPDGRQVDVYRFTNANGIELRVTNYGGIIVSLKTPDKEGKFDDIALGFDSLETYLSEEYRQANPYFGAIIGRYGNRIAGGSSPLRGKAIH